MVAQRKNHIRCKTLVYLILIYLTACSDPQITIVEFDHIDPIKVSSIIERNAQDELQYDIIDKKIIFYADRKSIQDLIKLLQSLDQKSDQFLLSFNWGNKKRYSTIDLPSPIMINTTQETKITLFKNTYAINLKVLDDQQYSIQLEKLTQSSEAQTVVSSMRLPDDSKIYFSDTPQSKKTLHFQWIMKQGIPQLVSTDGFPSGIHAIIEKI